MSSPKPPVYIDVSKLPQGDDVWLSSTVTRPSTAEVRACSEGGDPEGDITFLRELGMVVKYGPEVFVAEGQTLWAMKEYLSGVVPVPEVYGWYREDEALFLYMELVDGVTLEECWLTIDMEERAAVCAQLGEMVTAWRDLRQDPDDQFLGQIGRQPIRDRISHMEAAPRILSSVEDFHDNFLFLLVSRRHPPFEGPHPWRAEFSDDVPIVFTHGDLHKSNFIVSREKPIRIKAVIDWEQSGWFPSYWEYCKTQSTVGFCKSKKLKEAGVDKDGSWKEKFIPLILPSGSEYWEPWFTTRHSLGY
ncbi:hypothetical protein H072_11042 [Dactylellina haptotyla CBS 200.50]|uniref:Aminoglycoside phosphotransferase domain-containing protein n=1 Tax=Dactylellina haptotyla (strain CBS 200.50) TaxID=1284197 RepID=S8BJX9_DACHA|nr:hypothetical protein H072_11042 [Dactylellina haptotyla CBS 200.50]